MYNGSILSSRPQNRRPQARLQTAKLFCNNCEFSLIKTWPKAFAEADFDI
jgi:hypothetical protein